MNERVRLVLAMLLIRPLPPHVAATDSALTRRVRVSTWLAYVVLACGLVSVVAAALGSNGSPWWVQGVHWLSTALLLIVTPCLFASIFNLRRGTRPRRPLRR